MASPKEKSRGLFYATVCGKYDSGGTGGQRGPLRSGMESREHTGRSAHSHLQARLRALQWPGSYSSITRRKSSTLHGRNPSVFKKSECTLTTITPRMYSRGGKSTLPSKRVRVLKEKRICFQIRGCACTSIQARYSNAEEAVEDLKRRGFTVRPLPLRRSKDINKLLSWSTAGTWRAGNVHNYQESARERLMVFQRPAREDAIMDEPHPRHLHLIS